MEEERKAAMEELSRGKEAALDHVKSNLESEKKKGINRELERQAEEYKRKLLDVEEEGRLGREELELRLAALARSEADHTNRDKEVESQLSKLSSDNKSLAEQLSKCHNQLKDFEDTKTKFNECK